MADESDKFKELNIDYSKQATELADLLEKTSVEYHNKNIAIELIERELKNTADQVKKITISGVSDWLTIEECGKLYKIMQQLII